MMPPGKGYPPKKQKGRKERAAGETKPVKRPTSQPSRPAVKRPVPPPASAMVREQLRDLEKKKAAARTPAERRRIEDEIQFFKHHHTIRGRTPR